MSKLRQTVRDGSSSSIEDSKKDKNRQATKKKKETKSIISKPASKQFDKKESLKIKRGKKPSTTSQKKKPKKIIEFIPNQRHDIEEMKDEVPFGEISQKPDKNSKRPKKGDRTYYQNFDFFFKRTCFRTMTLFYKLAYKPFFDKWKANKKKYTVLESLIRFAKEHFGGLLDTLGEKARFEFIELLKLLVLSHRHNKNDDFLADPLIDFATVREPMYKYSKQAQDRFFSLSTYSFLFAWFAEGPAGRAFAVEKFAENVDAQFPERMMTEVGQLGVEAREHLKNPFERHTSSVVVMSRKSFQSQAESTQMSIKLAAYFDRERANWQ